MCWWWKARPETAEALAKKLTDRKVNVLRLSARLGSEEIIARLTGWLAEGPITGVYFLPALEIEPKLAEMNIKDWQTGLEERLYSLYTIMKALPEETFLVCATRLGGLHGYSAEGASAPLGGATSGFAKAVAREREKAFVKVVDFETGATRGGHRHTPDRRNLARPRRPRNRLGKRSTLWYRQPWNSLCPQKTTSLWNRAAFS